MRLLILAAGTALALGACRNNDQHDNTQNVDENLTAESIVSNDVTAIDAVTGDAANMAADVNYTAVPAVNSGNSEESGTPASTPRPRPKREVTPPAKPSTTTPAATTPAASATTNAD